MLLYPVLFLQILVTLSAGDSRLTPGWGPERDGPDLGGVYYIKPRTHGIDSINYERIPCIVLFRRQGERKTYGVLQVYQQRPKPVNAIYFGTFSQSLTLQTVRGPRGTTSYSVILQRVFDVDGDPLVMMIYDNKLAVMAEEGLDKLVAASLGLVDGRYESVKEGGLYWLRPAQFGIKDEAIYEAMPCILLRSLQVGNRHTGHVVRISRTPLDGEGSEPATDFFENDAKLKTRDTVDDLKDYYIFPRKTYEVADVPTIMRVWKTGISTIMKDTDLAALVVASKMRDGWDANHKLKLRGVYWIRRRFLTKPGFQKFRNHQGRDYIPCVVIDLVVGDKYRVVKLSKLGQSARMYFGDKAKLQTPTGITDFQNYYFYPKNGYEVKADPKIIQRWEEGEITIMDENKMNQLKKIVFPDPNGPKQAPESHSTMDRQVLSKRGSLASVCAHTQGEIGYIVLDAICMVMS